jgi:hypothetical protein
MEISRNAHGASTAEFQPPANILTCRQRAFVICSLQSTEFVPLLHDSIMRCFLMIALASG